jgi:hypothetical protein
MNTHGKKNLAVDKFANRQMDCISGTGYFCQIPFKSNFALRDYDLMISFHERAESDLNNFVRR